MKEDMSVQLSEKVLLGYCQLNHILLYYTKKYPEIEKMANEKIDEFLNKPEKRNKKTIPELGSLIILLSISNRTWKDLCYDYFIESCERGVLWTLKKCPQLSKLNDSEISHFRINTTFKTSIVARRLMMFQAYFLTNISKPNGKTWKDLLSEYELTMGTPSSEQKLDLHRRCKKILQVDNFEDFFEFCYMNLIDKKELTAILKNAVANSEKKGYTQDNKYQEEVYNGKLEKKKRYKKMEVEERFSVEGWGIHHEDQNYKSKFVVNKPKLSKEDRFSGDGWGSHRNSRQENKRWTDSNRNQGNERRWGDDRRKEGDNERRWGTRRDKD